MVKLTNSNWTGQTDMWNCQSQSNNSPFWIQKAKIRCLYIKTI